jgi:hypothetical protein
MAEGDLTKAARLLGHVERIPVGISKDALAETSAEVESNLPGAERDRLVEEGATADYRQVLGWLREN